MENKMKVNVIGAGLAGVEAAYQLAKNGIKVKLYEMRPVKMTPAHHTASFAELVCSNSLRGDNFNNAVGILKNEMEKLDSVIIRFARKNSVPAGGALAVDRENFSKDITDFITNHPNIEVVHSILFVYIEYSFGSPDQLLMQYIPQAFPVHIQI